MSPHPCSYKCCHEERERESVCEEDKKTAVGHRTKNQKRLNYSINDTGYSTRRRLRKDERQEVR